MKDPMSLYPPNDELWLLTDAVCDGTITAGQRDRLEGLLRNSEEARLFYAAYMDVHGALLWQWRDSEVTLPKVASQERTVRVRWYWAAAMLLFALAGLAAVATGLLRGPAPEPIGHMTGAVDCRWTTPSTVAVGQMLYPHQDLSLQAGVAQITLKDGATIVLRQHTHVRFESANLVDLRQGRMWVHMPADAPGLTIHTPGGEVVDLGTEFGVLVEPDGLTEVHVFDGGVLVKPPGGVEQQFGANRAVQLASGLLTEIEPTEKKFRAMSDESSEPILLAGTFADESLDGAKWRTILPFTESRVDLTENAVQLINGSHLVTARQFDPLVSGSLRITGTVRFPTFGPHERFHELDIVTRGDGRMREKAFPQASGGIVYTLSTKVPHAGSLAGSNAQIWVAGRNFRLSRPVVTGRLEFRHDASYRFEIIDDGLQLSVTLSQADDPANRVTVTATVIKDTSDSNWIAFYGCKQYEGRESISELSDLRIELGGP